MLARSSSMLSEFRGLDEGNVLLVEAAGCEGVEVLLAERDERRLLVEDVLVAVELELGQRGAALEERINSLARARTPLACGAQRCVVEGSRHGLVPASLQWKGAHAPRS